TGEQVHVSRSDDAVQVKGIVDTNERKQELLAQLRMLPYVSASILSVEELSSGTAQANADITSVRQYSVDAPPSPLQEYFRSQSRSPEDLNRVTHTLLDASLSVGREGGSITELLDRFASQHLTEQSATAVGELISHHLERLSAQLRLEEDAIRQIGIP